MRVTRLAAAGAHHRQIDRHPARIVAGAARPQPMQRTGEGAGQPRDIGEIGQQTGSGVADHSTTVGRDDELGTRPGGVHVESAFLPW